MKKLVAFATLLILVMLVTGCGVKIPTISIPPLTTAASTTSSQTTTTPTPTQTTPVKTTTPPPTTTAQPPAQVSGTIYFREPSVSFKVDTDPSPYGMEGATVSVSGYNVVSGEGGQYTIPAGPGFQTIYVTADGYIPAKVSWTFLSGQSYVFNIGLYKEPASITPHAGFVNGIITWDAGGWLIDYYYKNGLFQQTYSAAVQNAGGNLVTVSDPVFVKAVDVNHIVMSTVSIEGGYWRMMNETEYTALVTDAHNKGLEFMLWLGVLDEGKTDYNKIVYADGARTGAFWDDWFSEYEKYAVQYAAMAEKLDMEYINLGHDMGYATGAFRFNGGDGDCLNRWAKLITAIRAVYDGKLSYFGTADYFYEDNYYPPGFVNLFDAIGINVQSVNSTFNPSLAELKTLITNLLNRYTTWQKPLFIMVRTPSVDGGTSFTTYIEPLLWAGREADKHAMNLFQQADIYEAFYEVINSRPAGNGQVMGIFPWSYNYLDDYLVVKGKSDGQMAMDKSANIRGKPAEAVMRFWTFR